MTTRLGEIGTLTLNEDAHELFLRLQSEILHLRKEQFEAIDAHFAKEYKLQKAPLAEFENRKLAIIELAERMIAAQNFVSTDKGL